MQTARSASRVCSAPRSAVEYTATASIPSSCSARMTRTATSPRFATRTRLKRIERPAVQRLELEEELPELDRLGVLDRDRTDDALDIGLHFVHELHRLEDAERLARRDRIALLDEGRRARQVGEAVLRPPHGHTQVVVLDRDLPHSGLLDEPDEIADPRRAGLVDGAGGEDLLAAAPPADRPQERLGLLPEEPEQE